MFVCLFGIWVLGFGISFTFGCSVWDLGFFWDLEFGIWDLFRLVSPQRFPRYPPLLLQQPLVNASRIQAPAGGQERHLVHICGDEVRFGKRIAFSRLGIIEAFKIQFFFGGGSAALFPESFARPGIGTNNAAT